MEIVSFDRLDSTQKYLVSAIRDSRLVAPVAIIANEQIDGVGSRGNRWEGGLGNLYTSIAVPKSYMPSDLPTISASLYFGWIMRDVLYRYNNNVWLKWPNDIYLDSDKIGGVITNILKDTLIVGIGVNLKSGSNSYRALDIKKEPLELLREYIVALEATPSWKSIFSKYQLEFEKSKMAITHYKDSVIDMHNAILCDDGCIIKNGERIVSLR